MTPQEITPQLRQWIIDQAAAGFNPEAVLKAMVASGWTEDVAIAALESTLQAHVQTLQTQTQTRAQTPEQAPEQVLPPSVPVPDLPLDGEPLYIDAGGRRVHVLTVVQQPRIVVLGGFLSDGECDALILAAKPQMKRSLTISVKTGGEETNDARTSNGMFFQRGANDIVRRIEQRIARLLAWPQDEAVLRERIAVGVDRSFHPAGTLRQMLAVGADTGQRVRALGRLRLPTLVLHGKADPLVPYACGEDTARRIPGAHLVGIEGMGHDLPPQAVKELLAHIIPFVKSGAVAP